MRLGIYIHWPYCRSKCPYCDFLSYVKKNVEQSVLVDGYLSDLEYYRSLNDEYKVDTIFFGGGTPSLLEPKQIERILDKIIGLWPTADNLEISLEANPNSQYPTLFKDLRQSGINRLSLGVQALNDKDLKFLGRTHDMKEALSAIDLVKKNFDNHSIDLIYARPEQTVCEWKKELNQVCNLGLKHLSLYQLTIEEGTVFSQKGIKPAAEEKAAELYNITTQILADFGYEQYEISNYAQKGYECRHNLGYWHGDDYIGIGKGAVGYLHIGDKILTTTHPRQLTEVLPTERAEELLIMGLRLNEGINKRRFERHCGIKWQDFVCQQQINELIKENLVTETSENIKATSNGRLLLNYVIEKICV